MAGYIFFNQKSTSGLTCEFCLMYSMKTLLYIF